MSKNEERTVQMSGVSVKTGDRVVYEPKPQKEMDSPSGEYTTLEGHPPFGLRQHICDLCLRSLGKELRANILLTFYRGDGRGPWAITCLRCADLHGAHFGAGSGNLYEYDGYRVDVPEGWKLPQYADLIAWYIKRVKGDLT